MVKVVIGTKYERIWIYDLEHNKYIRSCPLLSIFVSLLDRDERIGMSYSLNS